MIYYKITPSGEEYYGRLSSVVDRLKHSSRSMSDKKYRDMFILEDINSSGIVVGKKAKPILKRLLNLGYIVKVEDSPKYATYHITPSYNLERIKREGLRKELEGSTTAGGYISYRKNVPKGNIYLYPTRKDSDLSKLVDEMVYPEELDPDPDLEWSILEVKIPKGVRLHEDETFGRGREHGSAIVVRRNIPASSIKYIETSKLRDFIPYYDWDKDEEDDY